MSGAPAAAGPRGARPPAAVAPVDGLVDVAPRGTARQSSRSSWSRPDDAAGALGAHDRPFGFHTGLEDGPWWELALDRAHALQAVVVHNRRGPLAARAAPLVVEASRDGRTWTLLHRGLCHFGGAGDPGGRPPLVLPLGGEVVAAFLRLSLPGRTHLHLARVEILVDPARDPAGDAPSGDGPVFFAARPDGFGERLRALMNAMTLAARFGGGFRLAWPPARPQDQAAHAILPAEETFAPDFLAAHGAPAPEEGRGPGRAYARLDAALREGAVDPAAFAPGRRFRVEQTPLAEALPGLDLPAGASAAAFARIGFGDRLEAARRAALAAALPAGAAAIHLRAGDLLYGRNRLAGHFASKALAWPLAFGLAERLRAEGRTPVVFGQDRALCRRLAAAGGGVFAGDLAVAGGFDVYQAVLFDIVLMGRCAEIFAAASGFALAACQIAGVAPARAEDRLGEARVRALLLDALAGRAPEDGAEGTNGGADAAISDLQRAFAFWSAVFVHGSLFDLAERTAFLAAAIRHDPENPLYRLAHVRATLEAGAEAAAAAELAALVEAGAGSAGADDGDGLRYVLCRRRADGRSIAARIVRSFRPLARRGHAGALLCLALAGPDREAAARFRAIRPARLAGWDAAVALAEGGGGGAEG